MGTQTLTVPVGTPKEFRCPKDPTEFSDRLISPITVRVVITTGTVTVKCQISAAGSLVAVSSGNLAGTISATAVDVIIGPFYKLEFTALTATATVDIAW